MSFLSGTKNLPTPPQKNLGLSTANAATNEQGAPLFYLAGKRRFAGTFLSDAFDQVAMAVGGGGKDSGKGGGGRGTNYYAGCGVAFCHGPADGFHDFYLNGDPVYTQNTPLIPIVLSQASNLATFQTANPHGVTTGQTGVVSGADQPEFNGIFTFTVTSPTEFTYTIPGSSLSAETATGPIQCFILSGSVQAAKTFAGLALKRRLMVRLGLVRVSDIRLPPKRRQVDRGDRSRSADNG